MTRIRFLLLFIPVSLLVGCSGENSGTPSPDDPASDIRFGEIVKIQSEVLSEERELWIRTPDGAGDADANNIAYPVVYLLDGDANYYSVSGMIRQLSEVNGNMVSPEMVVVGIPNTDRFRDLTPSHTEGTSGGGDAFLDFLENEVIPYVENNYPVSTYRTFIGHSLGGLMVIDTLNSRPHLFENYIAIDPSLWWDERSVLKESELVLLDQNFSGKSLFVSIANTMPEGIAFEQVESDAGAATDHIRAIIRYTQLVEQNENNGLNFDWRYYDEDSHASVAMISEYDAIRFLFSWYVPREIDQLFMEGAIASAEDVVSYATNHFDEVSKRFGYAYSPPQDWVNMLGRSMTVYERPEGTLALFSLNLQNYPNSLAAHYWLGDYYASQDDTENAIRYFSRAVEIGDAPQSEQRLAELQASTNNE